MELQTQLTTISILAVGFALGLQHAIEADHLAAVSTIVSEKKNLWTASLIGGFWGIGHTIALFVVGIAVILLKLQISGAMEAALETGVGAMLILLGSNAIRKMRFADKVHIHVHEHDGTEHAHIHMHDRDLKPDSHHRLTARSILIGMVHGLAGSAALMLLIVPTIDSSIVALIYILVFGIGSIGGMMAMSLFIGLPFHFTADRFAGLHRGIRLMAGACSVGLGGFIIYEKLLSA